MTIARKSAPVQTGIMKPHRVLPIRYRSIPRRFVPESRFDKRARRSTIRSRIVGDIIRDILKTPESKFKCEQISRKCAPTEFMSLVNGLECLKLKC